MPRIANKAAAKKTAQRSSKSTAVGSKKPAPTAAPQPAAKKAKAKPVETRVRSARSDASLVKLQVTIEDQFKLPRGSVQLVAPGRRRMGETDRVEDLRAKWEKSAASSRPK